MSAENVPSVSAMWVLLGFAFICGAAFATVMILGARRLRKQDECNAGEMAEREDR